MTSRLRSPIIGAFAFPVTSRPFHLFTRRPTSTRRALRIDARRYGEGGTSRTAAPQQNPKLLLPLVSIKLNHGQWPSKALLQRDLAQSPDISIPNAPSPRIATGGHNVCGGVKPAKRIDLTDASSSVVQEPRINTTQGLPLISIPRFNPCCQQAGEHCEWDPLLNPHQGKPLLQDRGRHSHLQLRELRCRIAFQRREPHKAEVSTTLSAPRKRHRTVLIIHSDRVAELTRRANSEDTVSVRWTNHPIAHSPFKSKVGHNILAQAIRAESAAGSPPLIQTQPSPKPAIPPESVKARDKALKRRWR